MASIFFTVLKIAGITFLVLFGLVLFILLLVLFVPVRYRGKGNYFDSVFSTKLNLSWCLHIVSIWGMFQIGQDFHIYLKIFGITVYDNQKKRNQKKKHKKEKSTKTKLENNNEIQAAAMQEPSEEKIVAAIKEPSVEEAKAVEDIESVKSDSREKKQNILQKIKEFL